MEVTDANQESALTEAEELAQVMAGYDKNQARSDELPAEVDNEPEAPEVQIEPAIEAQPEVTVTDLAEELKSLKAKVAASQSDPETVRRMHGEIGNINRTLKALQTPAPEPVNDEDSAALDAIVEEYPELAGPLVKALRANQAKLAQMPASQEHEDIDARVSATVLKIREADAIEALSDEHPDYMEVRETPEYKTWLSSKSPEYQERFTTTWNPAVVARGLTEFKESIKKKETKQTRLASAITPQGVPHKAGPSALTDEEAIWAGYNKSHKRLK